MFFPSRAAVVVLQTRVKDLETQLRDERERTKYFRDRYERLADLHLYQHGAVAPVHVEPDRVGGTLTQAASVGARVMRAASAVGNDRGAFKEKHGSGSELPIELVRRS